MLPDMRRRCYFDLVFVALLFALTGTALAQKQPVAPFSAAQAGGPLPPGWAPLKLSSLKRQTEYKLVQDQGIVVLDAKADAAASGLLDVVDFDLKSTPVMQWRWKISNLIEGADNTNAAKEDSPVRIVLGFEGDKSKLGFRDRTASSLAKAGSGRELPYAQINYIWSNTKPVGTIIENPHTKRVQMIVAATGPAGVGKWIVLKRNVYDDFKRAFGEEPGRLTEVGVLTDTDNTGESVEAWYGDIEFQPATN
jgi:Protein of unknown function (DUF3047)